MKVLKQLFDNNRRWADNRKKSDPDFFNRLVHQQTPEYLWIGCSDSRVPANQIVGLDPGELFVHRNLANLVVDKDLNCVSVIQFAVEILKVKNIIVCGHYGCAGVKAVFEDTKLGITDDWLSQLRIIRNKHAKSIDSGREYSYRLKKLCELNVIEQVFNVCNISVIPNAWQKKQSLTIHGWIYDISDGLLQDLDVCISNIDELNTAKATVIPNLFKEN
jgi:carbonic anhydrase